MNAEKTPVSILQEVMQQRSIIPHYQLLSETGAKTHRPIFVVRVYADGMTGIGKGSSKRLAKQEAARNFLHRLGIEQALETDKQKKPNGIGSQVEVSRRIEYDEPSTASSIVMNFEKNDSTIRRKAVAILKYYTMQLNLPSPVYEEVNASGPAHDRVFTYKCSIGSFSKEASAPTKIEARDTSALLVFEALKAINFEIPKTETQGSSAEKLNAESIPGGSKELAEIVSTNYGAIFNESFDHFHIIKNYMLAKNILYEDLWKDNTEYDFNTLEKVLNTLGIKSNLSFMKQDAVFIACFLVDIIPAFYVIEIGDTLKEATESVAKNILYVLKVVTKL